MAVQISYYGQLIRQVGLHVRSPDTTYHGSLYTNQCSERVGDALPSILEAIPELGCASSATSPTIWITS